MTLDLPLLPALVMYYCMHTTLQVLDEIGINFGEAVPEAPAGEAPHAVENAASATQQPIASPAGGVGGGGGHHGPKAGGPGGGADAAMSELEARLNLLKRE